MGALKINLDIENVKVTDDGVDVKVKRSAGEANLVGINFIVSDGENTEVFEEETTMKQLATQTFSLNYTGLVKSVEIAPVLKSEAGKEKVGNVVDGEEREIFKTDDGSMESSAQGDAWDDGVNKWLEIDKSKLTSSHSLFIYGTSMSCAGAGAEAYRILINENNVLNFSWCEVQGDTDYKWVKFDIKKEWFNDGINKINFYDTSAWTIDNWRIGIDEDTDEGMSAWSSNSYPACQPVTGHDPLRQDGSCYNGELMIYIGGFNY